MLQEVSAVLDAQEHITHAVLSLAARVDEEDSMLSLETVSLVKDGQGGTIELSRILIDGSDQGWGLQVLIRDPIAVQAGVPTSEYRLLNKAEMKNAMRELFDRAAEGLRD